MGNEPGKYNGKEVCSGGVQEGMLLKCLVGISTTAATDWKSWSFCPTTWNTQYERLLTSDFSLQWKSLLKGCSILGIPLKAWVGKAGSFVE